MNNLITIWQNYKLNLYNRLISKESNNCLKFIYLPEFIRLCDSFAAW